MTVTVVLNDDELAGYKAREEAHEQLKSDFQELVKENANIAETIVKLKEFLKDTCEGNEYAIFTAKALLDYLGVKNYTEWIGEWRRPNA